MAKKPTVLMILDGFGENPKREHNAVALAESPNIDRLKAECPKKKSECYRNKLNP